jgi:ribonucleotide monophosphatase NagD (HAD superfamily)
VPPTFALPHRGWLFDLDGTVYRGEALIPGADDAIAALRATGRRVAFLSNKPIQTREDYARKLTRLGIPTPMDDVINSSWRAIWRGSIAARRSSSSASRR